MCTVFPYVHLKHSLQSLDRDESYRLQVTAQVGMVGTGDQLMMSYEMLPANTVLCSR